MPQDKIINVSINDLIPNKYQPRNNFDEKALNELSKSIKEYGILNPILVRTKEDKYEIIAGERRYRAAKNAGLTEIPVIIKNIKEEELAELALIENLHRENLNPIEEAKSYEEIMKISNMTQQSLGEKLGKSQSFIANKLRLLTLPSQIQDALINKRISERHARSLMKVSDEKRQQELLTRIINEKLTVKDLDTIINDKAITEAEIKSAIDDIMKSLNIENEKDKKEEKESDNMNNGNFFPNYNNIVGSNENVSLNSMNMQSMNQPQIQPAQETVMPTPSISPLPEALPQMNMEPVQAPQVMDTPLFTPQFETQPVVENFSNNQNLFGGNMVISMPTQPIEPTPSLNQSSIPVVEEFSQPIIPQVQETVMPSPSVSPLPEALPQINMEPVQAPQMMDTPLFAQQFDVPQTVQPEIENTPIIMPQEETSIMNQPIAEEVPLYNIPVNAPAPIEPAVEENNLTKVTEFLNQNGITYKSYSNETNHCIIIEL